MRATSGVDRVGPWGRAANNHMIGAAFVLYQRAVICELVMHEVLRFAQDDNQQNEAANLWGTPVTARQRTSASAPAPCQYSPSMLRTRCEHAPSCRSLLPPP